MLALLGTLPIGRGVLRVKNQVLFVPMSIMWSARAPTFAASVACYHAPALFLRFGGTLQPSIPSRSLPLPLRSRISVRNESCLSRIEGKMEMRAVAVAIQLAAAHDD